MLVLRIADYRNELEDALREAKSADLAVAFAGDTGLRFGQVEPKLLSLLQAGGNVRILVDLKMGNTHPRFLEKMVTWKSQGFKIDCCHYEMPNGVLHTKLYIFELADGARRIIVGSANWTEQAYSSNVEYGVVIEGSSEEKIIVQIQNFFDGLWDSNNAKTIDAHAIEIYRTYWRRWQNLERKARKKATTVWGRLQEHLASALPPTGFRWPSHDVAFLLGALAARGTIDKANHIISIEFRYGGAAYQHKGRRGYIGKGDVGFEAAQVVQLIPQTVANRVRRVVSPAVSIVTTAGSSTYIIKIDCTNNMKLIEQLTEFFGPSANYYGFRIPQQIFKADKEIQEEFFRGYGLACALVSEGTYDPTRNHQVWLRPATANEEQFNQLVNLLQNSLGIIAYTHRRSDRDVHIKIRCEDWLDIGFGIDWLDAIVEEGARLNGALAPPSR